MDKSLVLTKAKAAIMSHDFITAARLYKDLLRDDASNVEYLKQLGIETVGNMVGEILTVQEAGGFQMNIAKWDDEILDLWNKPAHTPVFYKE